MAEITQIEIEPAVEVVRKVTVRQASNGILFGSYGETTFSAEDLDRIVQAVPTQIAAALRRRRYYFVPLTIGTSYVTQSTGALSVDVESDQPMIATNFSEEIGDHAVCHRNANIDGVDCTFISTRLMQDRFALSFEFFINAGHQFVEVAGVPESFMDLVWTQAEAGVRGETSQDAWEYRAKAFGTANFNRVSPSGKRQRRLKPGPEKISRKAPADDSIMDEKARTMYLEATFSDAVAIYLLSLTVDFDYSELREREYPLLAAPSLASRLQHVAKIFPPVAEYEFAVRYRSNS